MIKIGIYDSGIGGLTSAARIIKEFSGNDIYYLADNKNMPFGNKEDDELSEIVYNGIRKLRANSDVCVLACNTASCITQDNDVFRLMPPISEYINNDTLLMATPRTLTKINNLNACSVADTPDLAHLVELHASLCYRRRTTIDMQELRNYITTRLHKFKGIKTVILGCSHYPYCISQIRKVLGDVEFVDGNKALCRELGHHISAKPNESNIDFAFTLCNESKKYSYILRQLLDGSSAII